MPDPAHDGAWSIAAEAELLGISVRHLYALMAAHKPPVLRAGRRVLFDRIAHAALQEALRSRPEAARPASTSSPSPAAPPCTSAALSADAAYSKALAQLTAPSPRKPAPYGKRRSIVLPFTARRGHSAASPKPSSAT